MSTNSQDQEIDLSQIGKSISKVFQNAINACFDLLFFIQKKIIILGILFVIGVALAYFSDSKVYSHEISVIPNFGSNEYLYKKIEQINAKLREKDQKFFTDLGIKNPENILGIEIEAYPAIYNFINNRDQTNNFELIKLMAEDGNIDKIMKDEVTSKNYYHHKITIETKKTSKKEEFITPLLKYLNENTYFETQKKVNQKNLKDKIISNDSLIKQIDRLIVELSSSAKSGSSSSISITEKGSIPELVEKKDKLISEKQYLLTNENIYDQIIKEESVIINIRDYKPLFLNSKILYPFILIFIYLLGYWFSQVYKLQKKRIQ